MFARTAGGGFYTGITEKARAFADGDLDRLAAVVFAKWLAVNSVENHWHPDSLRFSAGCWGDVEALPSTLYDPSLVRVHPRAEFAFAVRIAGDVACIHGGTNVERWRDLAVEYPEGVPVSQLLSAADWLLSFPHLHTPCAEVALAKTQTASAAA